MWRATDRCFERRTMRFLTTLCPLFAGAIAAASLVPGVLQAAAPAPTAVVLAVDGVAQTRNLPILLAQRLGYFKNEGLAVTLIDAPAKPSPIELIQSGHADGAVAFYHHTIMSQANEHLVTQAVVTMGASPGLKLLVAQRLRGQIHSIADLKGRKIFTGGVNSGKTTSVNWLMIHAGLAIGDYTALEPTKHDAMAEAIRSGSADAIISHEPDASRFLAEGTAFELADLESAEGTRKALGTIFPSTALYLPKSYVEAHPDNVRHLVKACLRALAFINTHDAKAIAAALPPTVDPAAFTRLISEDKKMFDTDGRTPPDAAKAEWRAMAALTPKYGAISIEDTFTNAFLEVPR